MEIIYEESPNKECSKFKNNQNLNANFGLNKITTPTVKIFIFRLKFKKIFRTTSQNFHIQTDSQNCKTLQK